tara:strand:- start:707 stop:934 length:228 start_codon:yes stop_codon:yes gene_type:complete
MLDWNAPTGGYLINGRLALGRQAGLGAIKWTRNAFNWDSSSVTHIYPIAGEYLFRDSMVKKIQLSGRRHLYIVVT